MKGPFSALPTEKFDHNVVENALSPAAYKGSGGIMSRNKAAYMEFVTKRGLGAATFTKRNTKLAFCILSREYLYGPSASLGSHQLLSNEKRD